MIPAQLSEDLVNLGDRYLMDNQLFLLRYLIPDGVEQECP